MNMYTCNRWHRSRCMLEHIRRAFRRADTRTCGHTGMRASRRRCPEEVLIIWYIIGIMIVNRISINAIIIIIYIYIYTHIHIYVYT